MCSRLANGEKAITPRLIKSIGGKEAASGSDVPSLPFDPQHMAFIRQAMADVTSVAGGTAVNTAKLGLGPVKMAGKTGTAQSHTYGSGHGAHGAQGAWALRDHGWFIAFAPADEPRYAMSVLVEHGGFGGDAAAPKAREIMRTILLKDPEILQRIQRSGSQIEAAPDAGPAEPDTADQPDIAPSTPLPDDGTHAT